VIIAFLFLGSAVDTYLHDYSITFPFKILAGLIGTGAILLLARSLKSVVLRKPVKA
jgi:hypothetical protein